MRKDTNDNLTIGEHLMLLDKSETAIDAVLNGEYHEVKSTKEFSSLATICAQLKSLKLGKWVAHKHRTKEGGWAWRIE